MKTAGCNMRPGGGDVVKRILDSRLLPRAARPRQRHCRTRFLTMGTTMTINPDQPRLTLRPDLRDAEGEPRICIMLAGRALPRAFRSVAAALAALREMEGRRNA